MYVKQLSVFIENTPGCLSAFARLLADNKIDLVSLSIADTTHFGILRCIVADYEQAEKLIAEAGYTVRVSDVLAASVPDTPGGMAHVLSLLTDAGISIEYLYSFVRNAGSHALLVFRVDELDKAAQVLADNQVKMLTQDEVRTL